MRILTAALNEPGSPLPDLPSTTFTDGKLNGTKVAVPYAAQADWLIVTANNAVVVVSPKADGVEVTKTPTSNHGDEYTVTFSDSPVDGVLDGATPRRVNQLALAAIGWFAAGLVAGALRLTADYVANSRTIRQATVDIPDGRRATRRGLHRFSHTDSGGDIGGLAIGRGA